MRFEMSSPELQFEITIMHYFAHWIRPYRSNMTIRNISLNIEKEY